MKNMQIQYTIRRVPKRVDSVLRQKAIREHKSINEVAVDALQRGLGVDGEAHIHHDLDDLAGTWVSDDEFDQAIEAMDQVEPDLWQ
jgi:hypothetical protein